ncbi:15 kDa protein B-like [Phyllostomus hastatus]|uniref:15 kDa protein B-like n=1 Tax=Phyllostomus hastatus TaxID=9423 RepID=UPI001E685799|nr:15 kDa protein B-like [Phyllostomus hastatus]
MAGAWRALLLMAGVAVMVCAAQRQSYEEIVTQALQVFNYGRLGKPLFGLLAVNPQPGTNSTTLTLLSFRVKETVCVSRRRQRRPPQECTFREGGEERDCSGSFFRLRRFRILTVDCTPVERRQEEVSRRKRSAESPGAATPDFDRSKLPPAVRDMYDKAKYDIITNILRNF